MSSPYNNNKHFNEYDENDWNRYWTEDEIKEKIDQLVSPTYNSRYDLSGALVQLTATDRSPVITKEEDLGSAGSVMAAVALEGIRDRLLKKGVLTESERNTLDEAIRLLDPSGKVRDAVRDIDRGWEIDEEG